jgi:peroxiredoxin
MILIMVCPPGLLLAAEDEGPSFDPAAKVIESRVYLLHSPQVREELDLTGRQEERLDDILADIQRPLWRLRDVDPQFVAGRYRVTVKELVEKINSAVPAAVQLLNDKQNKRLDELVLQWEGLHVLKREKWADKLELSAKQRRQIKQAGERTNQAIALIYEKKRDGVDPQTMRKVLEKLREEERKKIESVLTKRQKRNVLKLRGRRFNFKNMDRRIYRAPEFEQVTAWINSEPLTMKELRGQVVAVHFWTYVCVNCRNNYPQMKRWHERFADVDFAMVGIHTPEIERDRKIENIKAAAEEEGLEYPIAVDNDKANWQAWDNHVWPSVYLVDRDGFIRYWWYGELGEQGDKLFVKRIRELLEER